MRGSVWGTEPVAEVDRACGGGGRSGGQGRMAEEGVSEVVQNAQAVADCCMSYIDLWVCVGWKGVVRT
jgi:hypothetical protein